MCKKDDMQFVIGLRQVLRELKKANVAKILLATDAEENYIETVLAEAKIYNVEVELSGTMEQIAQHYKIEVPSAVVGFLKP